VTGAALATIAGKISFIPYDGKNYAHLADSNPSGTLMRK